jgi:hypothetical protein
MMKPIDPIEKNGPLDRALQQWRVDATLPLRFGEEVWRRIAETEARREPSLWRDLFQAVEAAFCRPALAIFYVAILLLTGLGIGFTQARQESARMDAALGARYVQSVDPYQTPRH